MLEASRLEARAFPHTFRPVKIFAYSKTDLIPVLAGVFHASCLVAVFIYFPVLPWWVLLICGLLFSISISWNINGISHNFLHNQIGRAHV